MDPGHSRVPSPSQLPASFSKYHHPYFTSAEVQYLSEKQRGKLSATQEEKARQQACGFIEAVGSKIGLCVSAYREVDTIVDGKGQSQKDFSHRPESIPPVSPVLSSKGLQLL